MDKVCFSVTVQQDWFQLSLTVKHKEAGQAKESQNLLKLLEKYKEYKTRYARPIKFDSKLSNLGKLLTQNPSQFNSYFSI